VKKYYAINRHKTCSETKKPQRQQEHEQEQEHQHPSLPLSGCVRIDQTHRFALPSVSRLAIIARARSRPHELRVASPPPQTDRLRERSVASTLGGTTPLRPASFFKPGRTQPPSTATLTPRSVLILKPGATTPKQAVTLFGPDMPERESR
jgi:hypothetical protein